MARHVPGRIVEGKLIKRVNRSRHYLRWIRGYAWSVEALEQAKAHGVEVLELLEDSGRVLRVGINTVLERGKRFQFGGFEPQIGMAESAMTIVDKNQLELFGGGQ